MKLSQEADRLKQIREELKMTQAQFGACLGIKTTYDIERAKVKLSGELVLRLLRDYNVNPLWLYGESEAKYLDHRSKGVIPSIITVDNEGVENILMVNQKAAAGYAGNLDNQEFQEQLPAFSFPIPEYRNATFRCFQVEGHSMVPTILPGEWVITKAVDNLDKIKNNKIYVVVDEEGVRIKQVCNEPQKGHLILISINKEYGVETMQHDQVKEVWEFHSKITKELTVDHDQLKLDEIHNDIKELKAKIEK